MLASFLLLIVSCIASPDLSTNDDRAQTLEYRKRIQFLETENKSLRKENAFLRVAASRFLMIKAFVKSIDTEKGYSEEEKDVEDANGQETNGIQQFILDRTKSLEENPLKSEKATTENEVEKTTTIDSSSEYELNAEDVFPKRKNLKNEKE